MAKEIEPYVDGSSIVRKYERIIDQYRSDVLELRMKDALQLPLLASIIARSSHSDTSASTMRMSLRPRATSTRRTYPSCQMRDRSKRSLSDLGPQG
jgi:hypothetical protein